MLNSILYTGIGGYLILKGLPYTLKPRTLGHSEKFGEEPPARDEKAWPFRGEGFEVQELTQVPVRITKDAKTPEKLSKKEYNVIIIGGAVGGLSSAVCLKRRGVDDILVVEKNECPGDIWRSRYHRLHLHDIAEECSLPGWEIPSNFPVYCPRTQYANYLDTYAKGMEIQVQTLTLVKNAKKTPFGWDVTLEYLHPDVADNERLEMVKCRHLVLANGIYNDPMIPNIPNKFEKLQVHSSRYTNATELGLKNKEVLVVGFGNSACEIAVDLCEHEAKPTILIRSAQTIVPRWTMQWLQGLIYTHLIPLSSIPFGWMAIGAGLLALDPLIYLVQQYEYGGREGLKKLNVPLSRKGPALRAVLDNEPPVMDIGTIECAQKGLLQVVQGEIKEIHETEVEFLDGSKKKFDAIVWGTGYHIFQGHSHIFDPDLLQKVGTGVEAIKKNVLLPGSEHPGVRGLWFNYGRIQMLRDGARKLSWKIAADLKVSSKENDEVDLPQSWAMFAVKHAAVLGILAARNKVKSKL